MYESCAKFSLSPNKTLFTQCHNNYCFTSAKKTSAIGSHNNVNIISNQPLRNLTRSLMKLLKVLTSVQLHFIYVTFYSICKLMREAGKKLKFIFIVRSSPTFTVRNATQYSDIFH